MAGSPTGLSGEHTKGNASRPLNGSLTRWAVGVVCLALVGLAAYGARADIKHNTQSIKVNAVAAKEASEKAQRALDLQAYERTDVEVLKNEVKHMRAAVDRIERMLIEAERRRGR